MYLVAFLLGLLRAVASGYVLSKCWGWFVVPAFGVSELPTMRAVGIMYLGGFLSIGLHTAIRKAWPEKPKGDGIKTAVAESAIMIFLGCPLALGVAYLWHLAIVAWS